MHWIDVHWLQQGLDAVRATLDADGARRREQIEFLFECGFWDEKKLSWDAAVARFNACLNPAKPDFFKPSELWALMKRFGQHDLFLAMAADLGYEVRPIPTEARRQALLERVAAAYEKAGMEREAVSAELERLSAASLPAPTRIEPAVRNGVGRFSRTKCDLLVF